jgi:replicative DNA helicase
MPQENILPCNLEAEVGVLGSLVIDGEAIALIADTLRPEHFYREKHRLIYAAMLHLYEQQEPTDALSVSDLLERRGQLEQVGGFEYIAQTVNGVATSGLLETFAKRIIREYVRRRVIERGGAMVNLAWQCGDMGMSELLEQVESLAFGIAQDTQPVETASVGEVFTDFFNWFDSGSAQDGEITGVPSGLTDLDQLTGGFQRSDLIVTAGRPGMGKTSLALQIARNAAIDYKCGVLIFSLEMGKEQLIQRLVALETGIDLKRIRFRQVSEEERAEVINIGHKFLDAPIFIDDTAGISSIQMRSRIRRTLLKHPVDLVIIDYLQLVQAVVEGKRISNRYEEVSEVARELKNIARDFNIPVLALSQLSRAVETRQSKVPQLSDLRESGEIEQAADMIAFLYRDDYYAGFDRETGQSKSNRPGTADIVVAKHRNGPQGEVVVTFEASKTRFSDYEVKI